jgi:potassium channel
MEAEYFPPGELVVLQNEAPTDVYIIVSGAVVSAFIDSNIAFLGSF